jgi:hypothetical protein
MATLESKLQELKKENEVLSELNSSLISNQRTWKEKLAAADKVCAEKDATIQVCFTWWLLPQKLIPFSSSHSAVPGVKKQLFREL